jgi:hypothetical protein
MTIQKNTLLVAGFILVGMVSCNADTSDKDAFIIDSPASEPVEAPFPAITPVTATVEPAQALSINPAHGQPGHDCAVAVGAPLGGSAIGQTAAPTRITSTPITNPLGGPVPKFNANSNVNPAHGQPGHDCAVAVGAPLGGSTARQAAAPARISTSPISNPLGGPTPSFNANPNLNPAHGQPGHDCAVAVGAPLPSK